MSNVKLRLLIPLVVLVVVLSAGIIGFMYLENLSLVDALYFSVVTLGTVGFGDIHPQT
jgi:voltage-gated potassium channel